MVYMEDGWVECPLRFQGRCTNNGPFVGICELHWCRLYWVYLL